jgi:hypothetical protein
MGSIVPINVNSLIQAQYTELGKNEELELVYKGNGKEYVVESNIEKEKYTLSANLVENLAFKANIEKNDILNLMYIISKAFESYRMECESFVIPNPSHEKLITEVKKENDKYYSYNPDLLDKVISCLAQKHEIEIILSYFEDMNQFELVTLFSDEEKCDEIIAKIDNELTNKSYPGYDSEERDYDYDGVIHDDEVFDYYGGKKVFVRK